MIDRIAGAIVFTCDCCPEELETDERDFSEAVAALRNAKWRVEKIGSEWVHTCPAHEAAGRNDFQDVT